MLEDSMLATRILALIPALTTCALCQYYRISTVAGNGVPVDEPALTAHLQTPSSLVVSSNGDLYVSLNSYSVVAKIRNGRVTRIAGTGKAGFSGDGGPALNAQLNAPTTLALDMSGNLLVFDSLNYRVRAINTATGIITTVAGNGDGETITEPTAGPATSLALDPDTDVATAPDGAIYFAGHCIVSRLDTATRLVSTVAGAGCNRGIDEDGAALSVQLGAHLRITAGPQNALYVADYGRVRKIDLAAGSVLTVAGGGESGFLGDGGPATKASLDGVTDLTVGPGGDLFLADSGWGVIRKVDAQTGIISTVAGSTTAPYGGDSGPALKAGLGNQLSVAVDTSGNLFIAARLTDRIRRVDITTGIISLYAGNQYNNYSGDGGPAINAQVTPRSICSDASGSVYIADGDSFRVRRIDAATGVIQTVAGNGNSGFEGEGGPATSASLIPYAVAVDPFGNLYISDSGSQRVRRVDPAGVITTYAGGGTEAGEGLPATRLALTAPIALGTDREGNLLMLLDGARRVVRVERLTGLARTVAGTQGRTYGDDNGPAIEARLLQPVALALDSKDNIYIGDTGDGRVRRVDVATGIITTVAGSLQPTDIIRNGALATAVPLRDIHSIGFDRNNNLLIALQSPANMVVRVDAGDETITVIAGGTQCCSEESDRVLATAATLRYPNGLATGPDDIIYLAEDIRVRALTPIPEEEPVVGVAGNAAWPTAALSPGAWFTVTGANLSEITRSWTGADFFGNSLPTSLDNVSVTVAGKPAAISYVSPTQINAQCPDFVLDDRLTHLDIQVTKNGRQSNVITAPALIVAPALFSLFSLQHPEQRYVAGVHADGAVIGNPGDFGLPSTRPAAPGESIMLFGTGFGPGAPAVPSGTLLVEGPVSLAGRVSVIMKNRDIEPAYAGIISPGLVQINFTVPLDAITGPVFIRVNDQSQPGDQSLVLPIR
jgi:uncharacterized protein (TIGR03437 family)